MKKRFVLTPDARLELKHLLTDLAEDNLDAAERLRSDFYEALQRLGGSPGIGHYHEELMTRRFRFWNFRSYVVVYLWEVRPIQIVGIVHGARNLAMLFILRDKPQD